MQISENYFDIAPKDGSKYQMEVSLCTICCDQKNDILLQPCNHSGFCQGCMIEYLKYSQQCPFCRQTIQQIYLIYYDEDEKGYRAKGQIKTN